MNRKTIKYCISIGIIVVILLPTIFFSKNDQEGKFSNLTEIEKQEESKTTEKRAYYNEKGEIVLQADFEVCFTDFERTYQEDFDTTEWLGLPCVKVYIRFLNHADNFYMMENKLNHYLYENDYGFYVQFVQATNEEMGYSENYPINQVIEKYEEQGTIIDIYVTNDYREVVNKGKVISLTDVVTGRYKEEVTELYSKYTWKQLYVDNEIYGLSLNTRPVEKPVIVYTPQLTELYGIDMESFDGDLVSLIPIFDRCVQDKVSPMAVEIDDFLLSQYVGNETLGTIFTVTYENDAPLFVDWYETEELMDWYQNLGVLFEGDYIIYSSNTKIMLSRYGYSLSTPNFLDKYEYLLFSLEMNDVSSNYCIHNLSSTNERMNTEYYFYDVPSYIREPYNMNIIVVNAASEHQEESKRFLEMLYTTPKIRELLCKGIEGYDFEWDEEENVMKATTQVGGIAFGLFLEDDRRFFSNEIWAKKYINEIEQFNTDIHFSVFYDMEVECDEEWMPTYEKCYEIMTSNAEVFLGIYGTETRNRLDEIHAQLVEAGYLELIDHLNHKYGEQRSPFSVE